MAAEDRSQRRRPEERTLGEYHILIGRMAAEAIAQKIEKMTVDPVQNPGDWLRQLGDVLKMLADQIGDIASFSAEQKYAIAKRFDAGGPPDPQDLADLRRVKLKILHGKTGEERQAILNRWKNFESMQTTGPEYLRSVSATLLTDWAVAIYGARRLLRKIHNQGAIVFNKPAFKPANDAIREALACLVTIADEGLSVVDDWKRACRVTEFEEDADDDEAVAELFLHADALAEHLRGHKVQRRLEAVADRIRACSLTADVRTTVIDIDLDQWPKSRARRLMQKLLEDDLREGVKVQPASHGTVKELRRLLRETYGLRQVADAITRVNGRKATYHLSIPRTNLIWKPPKT